MADSPESRERWQGFKELLDQAEASPTISMWVVVRQEAQDLIEEHLGLLADMDDLQQAYELARCGAIPRGSE